ncbi:MAG: hypothetical protein WBD40_00490 [Tepidisphaeraceae bacterium]
MTLDRVIRRRSVYADKLLAFGDFVFSDGAEFDRRGAWREFFGRRIGSAFDGRVIFEIGCNDAALLARVAARHPMTGFIGIDWKCRALHTAAERVAALGLQNVALLHGRGQDVRRFFADGEVDEVWVFHPDPCDKPQELKNRLVAEPFLLDVHRVLRDRGALVLKTDHPDYYRWVLGLFGLGEAPGASGAVVDRFEVSAHSADFWNDEPTRSATAGKCFAGEASFFEHRYVRKRRPIHYVEMMKR